jgi:hypothetical protein
MNGGINSVCPHRIRMPNIYSPNPAFVLNQRAEEEGGPARNQDGVHKGHGGTGKISPSGDGKPNSSLSTEGIFNGDKTEMRERLSEIAIFVSLGLFIGIISFLIVITFWPFNPATFYKPVIHTPIVAPGGLFNYDMILDKHTAISPAIQRTLVCGKDENIIVLENAIGTTKTGNRRVRNITVEIPKGVSPNYCRILTHVSYPYFGGLRKVEHEIWTDWFKVKAP